MKVIEVKGVIGFLIAALVVILIIGLVIVLPVLLTQWGWNTWIAAVFESPRITWWQASLLALALLLGLVLLARQFVSFEIELVNVAPDASPDNTEDSADKEPSADDTPESGDTKPDDTQKDNH